VLLAAGGPARSGLQCVAQRLRRPSGVGLRPPPLRQAAGRRVPRRVRACGCRASEPPPISDEAPAGAAPPGGSRDEATPAGTTPSGKASVGPAGGFDGFAPETLETAGRRFLVRRATESDVPALVELLRDDVLGTAREGGDGADDAAAYGRTF